MHLPLSGDELNAYLERIGYEGSRKPELDVLQEIHLLHTKAIAFENLSPLLGERVPLDRASLLQKLVHEGRGGYCFEHNLLLHHVLFTLGFAVTDLAARVRWNMPGDLVMPRTHMLLRVDIDGQPYLVDAGFGGLTLTMPLQMVPDIEQATMHETYRLRSAGDAFLLQALIGQDWRPLYQFDQQVQQFADYQVSNWYVSTHPESQFVKNLIVARPDAGRRYALRNNLLTTYCYPDGEAEQQLLHAAPDLYDVLTRIFRLRLQPNPALSAMLQHIAGQ